MFRRTVLIAAVAALALAVGGSATGGSTAYPTFATPDGTGVSGDAAGALSVPALVPVESYDVPEVVVDPVAEPLNSPPGSFNTTLWGYEAAATGARILQYNIGPPVIAGTTCMPTHTAGFTTSQNGRGVAFDPLDGNLWNTHVDAAFNGDGFIHKNTPPPACTPVTSIPFGDGLGGTIQDDIGAIDVDEATKHLWVAGYKPVLVVPFGLLSYIYKVDRNTGAIINSCAIPFRGGGVGNETLAVYRNTSLPGSSKYLLTDAGEPVTVPNSYALIEQADCKNGAVVTPVKEFDKTTPGGVTGIDAEWPGLLASSLSALFNHGDQPFAAFTPHGAYGNSVQVEDISLCAFRAKVGGDGNDFCPYP